MGTKNKTENELSKSQEKRLQRRKEVSSAKRKSQVTRITLTVVGIVICAAIVFCIGYAIYKAANKTTASNAFSEQLNDDGTIKGVDISNKVTPCDYNNISIALADVEYSDDSVQADIDKQLDQHKTLEKDSTLEVADGDNINLDYVGTVDGTPFEGGDTEGNGTDLEIGSGSYVDDFEDQLIGTHPGDKLTVKVTFPEPYEQNPDLAGKDAEFAVTVNGIYVLPEFDDAFVAENLSDYASTADEYRTYLKDTNYDKNLRSKLQTYVADNSTASSYPSAYTKHLRATKKYNDESSFEYMNQMYQQYYGYTMYNSFNDYTGMSDDDYEKSLVDSSKKQATTDMAYQKIYTDLGLSITDDEYKDSVSKMGEDAEKTYGKGYIMQNLMKEKVIDELVKVAVVK